MKKKVIALCLTVLVSLFVFSGIVSAETHGYPNEKNGFRDLSWGTTLNSVKDQMVFVRQTSIYIYPVTFPCNVYIRNNDNLSMGGVNLKTIEYYFWKSRLVYVDVFVEPGYENYRKIREVCLSNFGPSCSDITDTAWYGNSTNIDLGLRDEKNNAACIIFNVGFETRKQVISQANMGDF